MDDNTRKPKHHKVPVGGAQVRVFVRGDACPNNLYVTKQPKHWGPIFETCPYIASGVTNASGDVFIAVPPTTSNPNTDYVVIGKTPPGFIDDDDDDPDAWYSGKQINKLDPCEHRDVKLRKVRRFDRKTVPCHEEEEWGTHLVIVEPDYMDWSSTVEQYPFILEAEGDWTVTTSIQPPEGFVPDVEQLSETVVDGDSAMQFTLTDVGSSWTEVGVTHNITHKGKKTKHVKKIKMYDRKSAVKGGGWINSPAGAYPANAGATGKVAYEFTAKFKQDGSPKGDAGFDLDVAGFSFQSTAVNSLVITNPKAIFRGTGKVNGTSGYSFQVTGYDKKAPGGSGSSDKLRIKIWKGSVVVYDNQMGAADSADPTKAIGDGNVRLPK